jgi:hypothetical protein
MELSQKQEIFLDYLIKKLNFKDDEFLRHYLDQLTRRITEFSYIFAKQIEVDEKSGRYNYPDDHIFKEYVEQDNLFIPTKLNIIDILLQERDVREERQYIIKKPSKHAISATDIKNYTYCPISFAISNSFQIKKPLTTQIGSEFHQQHRLLNFISYKKVDQKYYPLSRKIKDIISEVDLDSTSIELLDDLSESVAIFVDSSEYNSELKYFKGKHERYVGKPDYIFYNQRSNRYYVVEEKFQHIPREPIWDLPQEWTLSHNYNPTHINELRKTTIFYANHMNQLMSYISEISQYDLSYGYLVYWRYIVENDEDKSSNTRISTKKVDQIRSTKIDFTDKDYILSVEDIYKKIDQTMNDSGGSFDRNIISPAKCAGCAVRVLCGHKTGQYDEYTYPYSEKYIKTKYVPFPEELIRKNRDETKYDGSGIF